MALADLRKVFDRISAKLEVDDTTNCHIWRGAVNSKGYPCFGFRGRSVSVHRYLYALGVDVPPDHQVHHRCRNRRCVNVAHLNVLSPADHAHEHAPPGAPCGVCGGQRSRKKDGRWNCPACHRVRNLAWKRRVAAAQVASHP